MANTSLLFLHSGRALECKRQGIVQNFTPSSPTIIPHHHPPPHVCPRSSVAVEGKPVEPDRGPDRASEESEKVTRPVAAAMRRSRIAAAA